MDGRIWAGKHRPVTRGIGPPLSQRIVSLEYPAHCRGEPVLHLYALGPVGGRPFVPLGRAGFGVGSPVGHQQAPARGRVQVAVADVMRHVVDEGDHAARRQRQALNPQRLAGKGVDFARYPVGLHFVVVFGPRGIPPIGNAVEVGTGDNGQLAASIADPHSFGIAQGADALLR